MKFSDIDEQQWDELKPYLDTALLPVTGLRGNEQPWEATQRLEELRDALDLLELPFKGRTVTYPALHYLSGGGADAQSQLNEIGERLAQAGFRYVIVVTPCTEEQLPVAETERLPLVVRAEPARIRSDRAGLQRSVSEAVQKLWTSRESENNV